jgi:hypothetical protein
MHGMKLTKKPIGEHHVLILLLIPVFTEIGGIYHDFRKHDSRAIKLDVSTLM